MAWRAVEDEGCVGEGIEEVGVDYGLLGYL